MSLINDALKRARQAPPRNSPGVRPPLQPVAEESPSILIWLIPVIIILLIVGVIFFMGWATTHHTVLNIVNAPDQSATNQAAEEVPVVVVPPPEPPAPLNPPDAPRLQGIFYSPTKPMAIVDGKTVGPGDQFRQYRVKEITKYTVTLVGSDKKEIKIGMGN